MNEKKSTNLFRDSRINWKYIFIVVVLAFIVGGGILIYQWWASVYEVKPSEKQPQIQQKITITTDKTDYEIFEEPVASISNNSGKTINIYFQPERLFRVEEHINGEWKDVASYVSNIPASHIDYGNEESSHLQSIVVESDTNGKFNFCFCSNVKLKGGGIDFRMEKEEPFKPGKYRLIVPYSFEGLDVIKYIYSNEFVIKDYKFSDAEFFCKYKYSSLEYTKSNPYVDTKRIALAAGPPPDYRTNVYYSSFLNFDQDEEKELLVVCGDPNEYSYLYVLDKQNNEYREELLYREMSGQRHILGNLTVIDINKDGLDEIVFDEYTWYISGGDKRFVIYSPKHNEWFSRDDWQKRDIGSEKINEGTSFSSNLDLEEYKVFKEFLLSQ